MNIPSWILQAATIIGGIAAIIGLWDRIRRRRRDKLGLPRISASPRPAPWKRWTAATALLLATLAGVLLATGRAGSTDLSLDLVLSGLSFELTKETPLLSEPLRLAELGASGLTEVETPMRWVNGAGEPVGVLEAAALFVSAAPDTSGNSVYLDDLVLPVNTAVTVQATEYPRDFRLSLDRARVEPGVSVGGTVEVVVPAVLDTTRNFEPGKFRLIPSADWISFDLRLFSDSTGSFSSNLQVGNLEFHRVDRYRQGTAPKDVMVSTIVSGNLSFPHLDRQLEFEEGDGLWVTGSSGEMNLILSGEEIKLTFDGRVSELRIGTPELSRDIMPRRGEVWLARYTLITVPLLLLYAAAVFFTVRWWRGWA